MIYFLVVGSSPANALQEKLSTSESLGNSLENVIDPLQDKQSNDETDVSMPSNGGSIESYPDLGDDQVFPFVAGLDSYE